MDVQDCVCDSGLGTVPHVPLYERVCVCVPLPQPEHAPHADQTVGAYGVPVDNQFGKARVLEGIPVVQFCDIVTMPVHDEPQLPRQVRVIVCVPAPHPMHAPQLDHDDQ